MGIGRTGNMSKDFKGTFWIYILRMDNGNYYTGITNDLDRRVREHRNGGSKSTRRYLPVEIVWIKIVESREEARKLEVKIKSRGARRFLKTYG